MSAIRQALPQFLRTHKALIGLIGARVFDRRIPRGEARPCLTYMQVSADRLHTLEGHDGLIHARYQVTAWGGGKTPYTSATSLADLVRKVLAPAPGDVATYGAGFRGAIAYLDEASGGALTLTVRSCLCADENDLDQGPQAEFGKDKVDEGVALDFMIWAFE